jgi:hypothetical protein
MMRYPTNGVLFEGADKEVAMEVFFGVLWLITSWIAWRAGFVAGVDAALDNRLP